MKRDKNDAEMMHLFRSSDAEIVRNPDFTNAKSAQRIEKSFFWVVAVLMRKQGLLDSRSTFSVCEKCVCVRVRVRVRLRRTCVCVCVSLCVCVCVCVCSKTSHVNA